VHLESWGLTPQYAVLGSHGWVFYFDTLSKIQGAIIYLVCFVVNERGKGIEAAFVEV
jgi:hypothetical protein